MSQAIPKIDPAELAESLARREPLTVLDVRADAEWPIEAESARHVHLPAERALADPAAAAAGLDGPVAVVCNRGATAQAVAAALRAAGADAQVLAGGMRGWLGALQARPVDLGLEGVEVVQVQRPGRGCLSYLIAAGGEAIVVDPAPDAGFYAALAAEHGARVTQVFDTHLHADHLSGARALAERTGAALRLPEAALERGVAYADRVTPISDGERIELGPLTLTALALPGHTSDMTGLLVGERAVLSGDSLFADGIARPDLQRGDRDGALAMGARLHRTLRERLLSLPGGTLVLPGHAHPGVHAEAVAPTLDAVRATVPELAIEDPERFAAELLAEMPPRPANYESIIAANSGTHPLDPELESGGNSCATR
jgi:glyoxylase-like metal-dependent hydrolase (beta-lactamase superfamily II)